MPTIRDVAQKAGVAPITVSRVINNSGYVSEKTREKVQAAIDELGYVPNMLGPSLRFQQTLTLAVVITDITNPFWTTVTRGVEDVAQANGYSTILCNTDESEIKEEQYLNMLLRRRIDGILLVPASSEPESIKLIQKQGVPVVVMDRQVPGIDVDIVRADSEGGAYKLTQYLISLGHRRIAILAGPQSVSTSVDRVNGYLRALKDAGLPDSAAQVCWGEFTQESGNQLAMQALANSQRPTAIFCANNFIAIGARRFMHSSGIRIPEDIALATFDDIPLNLVADPFMTAAIQPAREMGQKATQVLLERIKGDLDSPSRHVVLPTDIIIRASSGENITS